MPDLDLIKQAEQGARDERGRSGEGRSGHRAWQPRTSANGNRRGNFAADSLQEQHTV
jgi:hypothetical protein